MKLALKASYVCIGIILLTTDIFALKHVIIQGEAAFAKGAEIRFYLCDELLTGNKTLITKTYINEEGAFQVEIPVLETRELILNINTSEGSIFVEPEKNYNIILHTNEQLINRIDAKYLGNTIQISILNSDTNELNWKINFFNQYYNYFLYKHSVPIISMIPQNVYDSLLQIITDRFPYISTP